jgi:hypothetical protein
MIEQATKQKWNPRYVIYAKSLGMTPEEALKSDKETWTGDTMCGFILWTTEWIESARRQHPEFFAGDALKDHAGYDAWLSSLMGAKLEGLIQ